MLILPIQDARDSMTLAADVLHPAHPDQVLLKRGFSLTPELIQKMADLGVLAIYIHYPDLDMLDAHIAPTLSRERFLIYSQIKATINAVNKTAAPTVCFGDYYFAVREFILTLFSQGQLPIYLDQLALRTGNNAVEHAAAVAHLSLLLGIKLHSYLRDQRKRLPVEHATEIVNLGIAGMLHDIGKSKLQPHFANFRTTHPPADPSDLTAWQSHPRIGYEMIRGGVESTAAVAVLQHHERFDGKGFPAIPTRHGKDITPAGQSIHIFARILLAADLFDQLTHADSHNSNQPARHPAVQVLHQLHTTYADWLDPVVLKALEQVVPPFTPGSRVTLSDHSTAVITALTKDPYRPIVRKLLPDNWTLADEPFDLSKRPDLQITTAENLPVQHMIPPPVPTPTPSPLIPQPA